MSWRDRLRPASFRNVPFKVETTGGSGGRRLVVTDYPGRDLPNVEDLGRKSRRYSLSAYVLGPDYEAARDALVVALEAAGVGALILPTTGSVQVQALDYSVEETKEAGGMCRFSLSFVEAGENRYPEGRADTKSDVGASVDRSYAAFTDDFAARFRFADLPDFVATTAAGQMGDLAGLLGGLRLGAERVRSIDDDIRSSWSSLLDDVLGDPKSVVQADPVGTVRSLLGGFRNAASPSAAQAGLDDAALYGAGLSATAAATPTTPSRVVEAGNTVALSALIVQAALAEQALLARDTDFDSYDAAASRRATLTGALGGVSVAAADRGDDRTYLALRDLSAAVSADLTARGGNLKRLVAWQRDAALPAAVIAYQLYGDAGRADDLVARNSVTHPLFMPRDGVALGV